MGHENSRTITFCSILFLAVLLLLCCNISFAAETASTASTIDLNAFLHSKLLEGVKTTVESYNSKIVTSPASYDILDSSIKTVVEKYSTEAVNGLKRLQSATVSFWAALAIIDLSWSICKDSFKIDLGKIITKVFSYSFIYFLLSKYNVMINDFIISFITSTIESSTTDLELSTRFLSQPGILLQNAVSMMAPFLNYMNDHNIFYFNTKILDILTSGPIGIDAKLLIMSCMTWLVLIYYMYLAVKVCFVYVKFYVAAAMGVFTIPFLQISWLKFFPNGILGAIISCGIHLILTGFMLYVSTVLIKSYTVSNIIQNDSITIENLVFHAKICFSMFAIGAMIVNVPSTIARQMSGKLNF